VTYRLFSVNRLRHLYSKAQFIPSLLGLLINPFFIIRLRLYQAIRDNSAFMTGRMLDFGCGSKPYRSLFEVSEYVGLDTNDSGHDHSHEEIDLFYDGKKIPFNDEYFDSVLSSEVFEHVFNLDEVLQEIGRVLKPGGHLMITLPFVWEEHEVPYDFARYTSFGISHILEQAGFEVAVSKKTTRYLETIFQLINAYIVKGIFRSNKYVKVILSPFLVAPLTILGIVLARILPNDESLYSNILIVAKKKGLDSAGLHADSAGEIDSVE